MIPFGAFGDGGAAAAQVVGARKLGLIDLWRYSGTIQEYLPLLGMFQQFTMASSTKEKAAVLGSAAKFLAGKTDNTFDDMVIDKVVRAATTAEFVELVDFILALAVTKAAEVEQQ